MCKKPGRVSSAANEMIKKNLCKRATQNARPHSFTWPSTLKRLCSKSEPKCMSLRELNTVEQLERKNWKGKWVEISS